MKTSIKLSRTTAFFLFLISLLIASCSDDKETLEDQILDGQEETDDNGQNEQGSDTGEQGNECPESIGFMFEEENGAFQSNLRTTAFLMGGN